MESRSKFRKTLLEALALPEMQHGDLLPGVDIVRQLRQQQDAAVLVGIVMHECGPTVLLTRRTDHLADHGGQVSFPGGRMEHRDRDSVETALRETEEELGIGREGIEILGTLSPYKTITNYRVTPVVGLVSPGFNLVPDSHEVAEVFEAPISFLRDPARRERRNRHFAGHDIGYWAFEEFEGQLIWGATAAMLIELCDRLDRVDPISQ